MEFEGKNHFCWMGLLRKLGGKLWEWDGRLEGWKTRRLEDLVDLFDNCLHVKVLINFRLSGLRTHARRNLPPINGSTVNQQHLGKPKVAIFRARSF